MEIQGQRWVKYIYQPKNIADASNHQKQETGTDTVESMASDL